MQPAEDLAGGQSPVVAHEEHVVVVGAEHQRWGGLKPAEPPCVDVSRRESAEAVWVLGRTRGARGSRSACPTPGGAHPSKGRWKGPGVGKRRGGGAFSLRGWGGGEVGSTPTSRVGVGALPPGPECECPTPSHRSLGGTERRGGAGWSAESWGEVRVDSLSSDREEPP